MRKALLPPKFSTSRWLLAMTLLLGIAGTAAAQTYVIPNNTPGFIKHAADQGAIAASTTMTATVWLKLHNEAQLQRLVQQQTQRGSASYHKWITQAQFNTSYSPNSQEVNSVVNFLKAHNLQILAVAENNFYVKVQGTAAQMESAFHVQLHSYNLKGQTYRSNNANPSVSGPAGGNIAAVTGLDDYGFQPQIARASSADGTVAWRPLANKPTGTFFEGQCFTGVESHTFTGTAPLSATYSGNRFGAPITNTQYGTLAPCGYNPAELQKAYSMSGLYQQGLTGAGETVVIVDAFGSSTIQQDAEVFSQVYHLPDLNSSNFHVYRAPGAVNNPHSGTWADEVTLDVEWVHAMAPGANIALVISPNNQNDLDEAVNWAVVHHLGNTISNSWATFEGLSNPAVFNRVNRILEMAAAQGMDANFASGDWGDNTPVVGFKTVCFPASSPFATGVGGTSLALNSDDSILWQSGWGTNITRIAGTAAQGNAPSDPPLNQGFQFGAGGGQSTYYARPSFQNSVSVSGNGRLVPDISMLADPYTGVEIVETIGGQLSVGVIGGTSLATPMFSGLMAIAAQKNGHAGLGQVAPLVYSLSSPAVSDVLPVGSANNVYGSITDSTGTTNYSADQLAAPLDGTLTYYSAFYNSPFSTRWFVLTFGTDTTLTTSAGWDNVTGVGTPNGTDFVNALVP